MIAKLFNVSRPAVLYWIRKSSKELPEPTVPKDVKEIEFDEMWHYIRKKKKNLDMENRGP